MKPSSFSVYAGDHTELAVYEKLISLGFRDVKMMEQRNRPYDLEVDGHPVEVKSALASSGRSWGFSPKSYSDGAPYPVLAYIFCLRGYPQEDRCGFIVIPGPLQCRRFAVTTDSLKEEHRDLIDNWSALQPDPYPLVPREFVHCPGNRRIARMRERMAVDPRIVPASTGMMYPHEINRELEAGLGINLEQDQGKGLAPAIMVAGKRFVPVRECKQKESVRPMAGKPHRIIIEPEQFATYLNGRRAALGLSVADYAKELGISRAAIYALMSGEMLPSEKVLKKVGLRSVYVASESLMGSDAPPKGKGKK